MPIRAEDEAEEAEDLRYAFRRAIDAERESGCRLIARGRRPEAPRREQRMEAHIEAPPVYDRPQQPLPISTSHCATPTIAPSYAPTARTAGMIRFAKRSVWVVVGTTGLMGEVESEVGV